MPTRRLSQLSAGLLLAGTSLFAVDAAAQAQTAVGTNRPLQLAPDSPYRDPDIVYLEADELINDEAANTLTATGGVVGRYQDRELRAERVIYNLETGEIFAEGDVTIVDPTGAAQFAEKVNLSNELQAGTATNFTLRTEDGGLTAAALAQQNPDGSISLYNAYYTACEVCADDPNPTWRIKARQVRQDKERNAIFYRDAVFELLGIPILYTPYLAHPDPSAERASGFLTPLVGFTGDKGAFIRQPYFIAVDPYTDLTLTPRIYSGVNPVLEVDFERKFATGDIIVETSLGYGSVFDNDGDPFRDASAFTNSDKAPVGRGLRSHTFASGRFNPNRTWTYGFGVELTSDDFYLENYDFSRFPDTRGLFTSDAFRLINQAYIVGAGEDWRVSAAAVGFQSQRDFIFELPNDQFRLSREDDGTLPIIAPRIDARRFFDVAGAEVEAFGNTVYLTREKGQDYGRATAGLRAAETFILPGGLELEPSALGRLDAYTLEPDVEGLDQDRDFTRALGYVSADLRYPLIRPGKVDFVIEPRVQATQTFGDGKLDRFVAEDINGNLISLQQDSLATDLDPTVLWDPNKSQGYDFWQSGTRVDAGATVAARWNDNEVSAFIGKSWADIDEDEQFSVASGLNGDNSDIVADVNVQLGSTLRGRTRIRYDDGSNTLRRIDSEAFLSLDDFQASLRYFRGEAATVDQLLNPDAPREEVSGGLRWQFKENWATSYRAFYDVDDNLLRRQDIGLTYSDDCTRIEIVYSEDKSENGRIGGSRGGGFAIRVSLATLGSLD